MFVREKRINGYTYLYLVETVREHGRAKQRIVKNLGRKEALAASGALERLASSVVTGSGSTQVSAITARFCGMNTATASRRIQSGPPHNLSTGPSRPPSSIIRGKIQSNRSVTNAIREPGHLMVMS